MSATPTAWARNLCFKCSNTKRVQTLAPVGSYASCATGNNSWKKSSTNDVSKPGGGSVTKDSVVQPACAAPRPVLWDKGLVLASWPATLPDFISFVVCASVAGLSPSLLLAISSAESYANSMPSRRSPNPSSHFSFSDRSFCNTDAIVNEKHNPTNEE
eukprot:3941553-Rhodomonas_salina.3